MIAGPLARGLHSFAPMRPTDTIRHSVTGAALALLTALHVSACASDNPPAPPDDQGLTLIHWSNCAPACTELHWEHLGFIGDHFCYDGCNACACTPDGPQGCTLRACLPNGDAGTPTDAGQSGCTCSASDLCCDGCQPRDAGPANCETDQGIGACVEGACVPYDGGA